MSTQQELSEDFPTGVYIKLSGTSRLPAGTRLGHNQNARALVVLRGTGTFTGEISGVDSEQAILEHAQVVEFQMAPKCPSCHGVV